MGLNLIKSTKENFSFKVFVLFASFIVLFSFFFTAFFIRHQNSLLTNSLLRNGNLLAGVLAYNSRVGVFSENKMMLRKLVDGFFRHKEVIGVSIYNHNGKLLEGRLLSERSGKRFEASNRNTNEIFEKLTNDRTPFYTEDNIRLSFWAPVISSSDFILDTSLFNGIYKSKVKGDNIGFAQITIDKGILKKESQKLLLTSTLIGIAFLFSGLLTGFFVFGKITRPLNSLTACVKALEKGEIVQKVRVETTDDIGRLARAFNNMSETLTTREDSLRKSEERLRFLSSRLLNAQEMERKRVSQELHDGVGQTLAFLKQRLRKIGRSLKKDQAELVTQCEKTNNDIDDIIEDLRRISRDLRPSILEDLGLKEALESLLKNFQEQHAIDISQNVMDISKEFPIESITNIYRIFQEILSNIVKHSKASHISFKVVEMENYVSYTVSDDGIGFELDKITAMNFNDRGMGLETMKERSYMLGGTIDIWSQLNIGTKIKLLIPIKKDKRN